MINFLTEKIAALRGKTQHEGLRRYGANTVWLFIARITGLTASFFVGTYLARYLGPNQYGQLSYVLNYGTLFAFIANLGIDALISRDLVSQKERTGIILGTAFTLKIAGAFIAIAATLVTSLFLNKDVNLQILILVYSSNYLISCFMITDAYFQSKVQSKKVVISQLTSTLIVSILRITLIQFKFDIFWFILTYLLDLTIVAIGLWYQFSRVENRPVFKFDFSLAKSLLSASWPLILSSAAIMIYLKIDGIMIKQILNDREVGIYAVAVKLSEMWYFLPGIICSSLYPAVLNAKSISIESYHRRMGYIYFLLFWLGVIIATPIALFSHFIIQTIFGSAYIEAASTLSIYAWSSIAVFVGIAVNQYLINENYTKITFWTTTVGMILNVVLNFILIPKIGIEGAAMATLISYFASTFSIVFFKETRPHVKLIFKGIFRLR